VNVSVVVPTYGRGDRLGATLGALLASDTRGPDAVEIIVVDGGLPEPERLSPLDSLSGFGMPVLTVAGLLGWKLSVGNGRHALISHARVRCHASMTSNVSSGSPRTLPLAGYPVCGSSDARPFLEMPDSLHGIPKTYV